MDSESRRNHPLLVDSSACLCRVDAGGTSKYVPGGRNPCTQPHVKPSVHPVRPKPAPERTRSPSPLLPGLPDDLAIACLIRVPRAGHRKLRLVCKRWQQLLSGNYFYSLRCNLGLAEEWIYIVRRDRDGGVSWHAFDPRFQIWHPLPPIPKDYSEAVIGFGAAVLSGCRLYLFGGRDPRKGSMRRVIFYSARTNKWHRAPDMLRRRHFFGYCVMNNCLFVAGGESEGAGRCLRSAEVYDPNRNRWSFVSEMSAAMVPFIGVVYGNRWFVKGLGVQQQVLGDAYFPETDTWHPAALRRGMASGWRNPSVCLNGQLYGLDCGDGCRVRVYNAAMDSWSRCADSGMHLGSSRALEAAALVVLGGKLCVVRNNMSITLVDVEGGGERRWETIAGGGQIKTFVTNLLSNIAGRSGLRNYIVHCQVLQA
ncbi:hypothetical protein Cni_G05763 [Canna indica]|uniref:F-box domain-containing protein n=1 Tax=Canna indica TaxID=4628 RepID=A0AAQ3K014_9LILI|nr:hypothetical protein Cni_G05763 [Canna indica]